MLQGGSMIRVDSDEACRKQHNAWSSSSFAVLASAIGRARTVTLQNRGLRGGVEQRVDEKAVRHFRLRTVLRAEAKQDDVALAHRLVGQSGRTAQILSAENPAAEQRLLGLIRRHGLRVARYMEAGALLKKDRHIRLRTKGKRVGRIDCNLQDGARDVEVFCRKPVKSVAHRTILFGVDERRLVQRDQCATRLSEGAEACKPRRTQTTAELRWHLWTFALFAATIASAGNRCRCVIRKHDDIEPLV